MASRTLKTYDVIVLGIGGMGSAALWALAKRKVNVLGLEQHSIAHAYGSSHGQSRLIRQAYFEHPDYVPLLKTAYQLWDELCTESKQKLLHRQGLVIFGPPNSAIMQGVRQSANTHSIGIQELANEAATRAYPQFAIPQDFNAVFEPNAGYLEVEGCVRAFTRCAVARGALVREQERVLRIEANDDEVRISTDRGYYVASQLIITAGPWSAQFLPQISLQLAIHRVALYWFAAQANYQRDQGMPCFGFAMDDGFYYGVPALDALGLKVGRHVVGAKISSPEAIDRNLDEGDLQRVRAFVQQCLPGADPGKLVTHAACMYTMTPDEHFILDRTQRITFGTGFSGHGYKFAPVVGEALADLALNGQTNHGIHFLRQNRLEPLLQGRKEHIPDHSI